MTKALKINKKSGDITHEEMNHFYGDKSMFFSNLEDAQEYFEQYKAEYPFKAAFLCKIVEYNQFDERISFVKKNGVMKEVKSYTAVKSSKYTKGYLVSTPYGKEAKK
jgi:hypothetical protein